MTYNIASLAAAAYVGAAEQRLQQFMPLVRRLAWNVHGSGIAGLELDDLIQVGAVALCECIQRHDPASDDGFAAYAKLRVRGAMIDLVRRAVPLARTSAGSRRALATARSTLTARLGRAPGFTELAEEMNMTATQLRHLVDAAEPLRFVDIADALADSDPQFADDAPDAFEQLSDGELRESLIGAVGRLPERLKLVVQLYFVEELSLAEIAAILEISVPRVHQLKAKAIELLQCELAG